MCGRYILGDLNWADYHAMLSIIPPDEPLVDVSYNIAPTQMMPVLIADGMSLRQVQARWGLVPPWHKGDPREMRYPTFNARIETAHEKPSFRQAWSSGRCLVPATGYYEWTGEKGAKQPWLIDVETNRSVFFFAGLFSERSDGLQSYTILTRAAEAPIDALHHRMPVVLSDDDLLKWINRLDDDDDVIESLGTGLGDRFRYRKVSDISKDAPPKMEI
jgi:putative SOS response-associated peptidase YedK